jgi:UDP-2,4-diacetamido-2,4,6-trideoxy-beta-L-altropyranose hydrolase
MHSVLFRCDGSHSVGFGHVVRCLALADELKDMGCVVSFAIREEGAMRSLAAQEKSFPVILSEECNSWDYSSWLEQAVVAAKADILILDVRDDLPVSVLHSLRNRGILIVTIDDPSDRRLAADMAFYPPVPQVERQGWTGFTGRLYVGWEWVLLRRYFADRPKRKEHGDSPVVLVTMGGSDPFGMTLKAVKSLNMMDVDFRAVVVLGPGFTHQKNFEELITNSKHCFDVRYNVFDMSQVMVNADLAIASFGMTAYELAAMGVPAVFTCLTEDHAESASAFVRAGISMSLGVYSDLALDDLVQSIADLLDNSEKRAQMASQARKLVDGRGARRIAKQIIKTCYP